MWNLMNFLEDAEGKIKVIVKVILGKVNLVKVN